MSEVDDKLLAAPLKLLILEDSDDDFLLMQLEFKRNLPLAELRRVQTLDDFTDGLGARDLDLIVSDYRLQGFTALEALEIRNRLRPDLPFIVASSSLGEEGAVAILRAGASDYVSKGSLGLLPAAIQRAAKAAGALREKRKLEHRLQQTQKLEAIGQLAAGVAHDFNNLLTVINGYAEILISQSLPDEVRQEVASEILAAGKRAAVMTQQLLAFSRHQVLAPQVVNINNLITESQKMLSRLIGEDIEINSDLDPALANIEIDPGQFMQIVVNLAVNARDAMPQGGKLTIKTANIMLHEGRAALIPGATAGPHVLLSVSDNGEGMTAEVRERLFEPFFTTKPIGKGTGLGMSTVHGIVKQSGGDIEVYSEPGLGTSFRVYFPVVAEAAETFQQAVLKTRGGSETILLAEDEPAVRNFAQMVLGNAGYQVLQAGNGREALEVGQQFDGTIHLLLTDLVMPEMSGRVAAEALQLVRPDLRVVYMSGYTDDAVVRHGLVEGQIQFLQKPFSPASLLQIIRQTLEEGRAARARA